MAEIEYFYSAHSSFAFIGSAELMAVAKRTGRSIRHKPMDLHRVMAARGSTGFGERDADYIRYHFRREIWRWAEYRGVEIMDARPTHHSNGYLRANLMLIAAIEAGADIDSLAHAFLVGHWRDDADLANEEALVRLADQAGCDGKALLTASEDAKIADIHEANTQEAIAAKMFGSPTYVVDGDIFYGQDHLELVERACHKAFGPAPA
ncbi:MAG: DsbA family protein [Kiloniellales bacterium]